MGYNLKILAEECVPTTLHSRSACLELRENFHDHVSDLRPVYTKEEFLAMSDHWIAARKKYDEAGQPDPEEQNITLDQRYLPGECLHKDRIALELTRGGAPEGDDMVHFHYDNFRIHMTKNNFLQMAQVFKEAMESFNHHYSGVVRLDGPDVYWSPVVEELYLPWLREYTGGANPDDFRDMFLESRRLLRPEEEQRFSDGWLKDTEGKPIITRTLPENFNRQYLYVVYECIRKYGYGEGPFKNDYIRAQRTNDGRLLLTGSHRVAALLHLGVQDVRVVEVRGFEGHRA